MQLLQPNSTDPLGLQQLVAVSFEQWEDPAGYHVVGVASMPACWRCQLAHDELVNDQETHLHMDHRRLLQCVFPSLLTRVRCTSRDHIGGC